MKAMMSEKTKVGKRFTVVVPKAVREKLGLREGQGLLVGVESSRIVIEPLPKDPSEVLRLIPDTYSEDRYEKKAEELLMKNARARH